MINVENIVFNTVANALRDEFSNIFVSGENIAAPSSFPAATIVEMDNSVYEWSIDSSSPENHAVLMYQVDAYSNKTSGRKAETKKIIANIDSTMLELGFVRVSCSPMVNIDSSIYRMVARYRAVGSTKKIIYHSTNRRKLWLTNFQLPAYWSSMRWNPPEAQGRRPVYSNPNIKSHLANLSRQAYR